MSKNEKNTEQKECLVPAINPLYVPFGDFETLKTIIESKKFYTVFITGLSGNGKTMMVDQVCALTNREYIRVNITEESDEDVLLGGFRLVDGCTKWFDGPVIKAMKRGAVLLLDEVDLSSHKIMCLQPVLEGRPVLLKRINQVVEPEPGFNIIATANTKGQGSDTGKFVGTNILNEAFLERYAITFEQKYPAKNIEKEILLKVLDSNGDLNEDTKQFVDVLLLWVESIRNTHNEGSIDEVVSTRRLVHIINAYHMFKDRERSLSLCLNRFDQATQMAFKELYQAVDKVPEVKDSDVKTAGKKDKIPQFQNDDIGSILGTNMTPDDLIKKLS